MARFVIGGKGRLVDGRRPLSGPIGILIALSPDKVPCPRGYWRPVVVTHTVFSCDAGIHRDAQTGRAASGCNDGFFYTGCLHF